MRSLALLTALSVAAAPASASALTDAQAAYGLFEVSRAEALYREAAGPASTAADRAAANRELARITWLVDGNAAGARTLLEASLPADPDPCPAALLYGRILNDEASPATTRANLTSWSKRCLPVEPAVALEEVRSYFLEARRLTGSERRRAATRGLEEWSRLPADARLSSRGATLQLELALQAQNRDQALAGWRAYFWLKAPKLALPAVDLRDSEIADAFTAGLGPQPGPREETRLAWLLMRAGFYDALLDYVQIHPASVSSKVKPNARVVAEYLRFRDRIGKEILAHDRAYARGRKDESAYEKRLAGILAETASALAPATSDPRLALRKWFGVWGTEPGKSNGVSGIHLGHVISDDRQAVSQDGRSGEIRLIVLDTMIHNSFSAWLMDGASAPGGWAVDGATIVQVRPRYLMQIDAYTRLAAPGQARDEAEKDLERQAVKDRELAGRERLAFFPGTKTRLRLHAIRQLETEVRARTRSEGEFQLEFRRAYWDALIGSSIVAHEGRHVLDQLSYRGDCALADAELEYRAKLSEIRFAPSPRLAVSSIYSQLFGGSSGHGKANVRLFTDYAEWIAAHRSEVSGYDPKLSELEQLDRLSDTQLVSIAKSLEPAAGCKAQATA